METTWTIHHLERQLPDGLVITAHWTVDTTDGDYSAHSFGQTSFDRGDTFIPYEELTNEQVVDWIKNNSDLAAIEATLQAQIDTQKTPVLAVETPPWGVAPVVVDIPTE